MSAAEYLKRIQIICEAISHASHQKINLFVSFLLEGIRFVIGFASGNVFQNSATAIAALDAKESGSKESTKF